MLVSLDQSLERDLMTNSCCLPPMQVANHSVNVVQSLGRDAIKALGVPPDAFIQCAIQLAFNRTSNGRPAPTYEACSTRSFLHGRSDICLHPRP